LKEKALDDSIVASAGRERGEIDWTDLGLWAAMRRNPVHPVNPVKNSATPPLCGKLFSFQFEYATRCRISENVSQRKLLCVLCVLCGIEVFNGFQCSSKKLRALGVLRVRLFRGRQKWAKNTRQDAASPKILKILSKNSLRLLRLCGKLFLG
jgi:hypothetical protein